MPPTADYSALTYTPRARKLLEDATQLSSLPGPLFGYGADETHLRAAKRAADAAGFDAALSDRLGALAFETLAPTFTGSRLYDARTLLADALLAACLEPLLAEELHHALMRGWWRALDDERWIPAQPLAGAYANPNSSAPRYA